MAELHFFTGTMDSGKSTLALQTNHNHAARGRVGRIFTTHDRAGEAILSSRLGLTHDAIEVEDDFDFWRYVVDSLTAGARVDYLICDEAQFYLTAQIEQLAKIVDELQIDVFAFGILTDFRTRLFLATPIHTFRAHPPAPHPAPPRQDRRDVSSTTPGTCREPPTWTWTPTWPRRPELVAVTRCRSPRGSPPRCGGPAYAATRRW